MPVLASLRGCSAGRDAVLDRELWLSCYVPFSHSRRRGIWIDIQYAMSAGPENDQNTLPVSCMTPPAGRASRFGHDRCPRFENHMQMSRQGELVYGAGKTVSASRRETKAQRRPSALPHGHILHRGRAHHRLLISSPSRT